LSLEGAVESPAPVADFLVKARPAIKRAPAKRQKPTPPPSSRAPRPGRGISKRPEGAQTSGRRSGSGIAARRSWRTRTIASENFSILFLFKGLQGGKFSPPTVQRYFGGTKPPDSTAVIRLPASERLFFDFVSFQ
jgi:hypothetical protein